MADTQTLLSILGKAARQLRATRGRKGMVVWLDDADDVLVAGDLHGNLVNCRHLLELADLERQPGRHLVLQEFVHGPGRYAKGGDTSHQLLDFVAALVLKYSHRVHLLMGNHEHAEWTGRSIAKDGVQQNELFFRGIQTAHGDRADDVVAAYHELFAAMPLAARTPNRVMMVHSIPAARYVDDFDLAIFDRWGIPEDQRGSGSALHRLLWGRDTTESTASRFAQRIDADWLITGHIACEKGYAVPNPRQLIVDCVAAPAACVLFPASQTLTFDQLIGGVRFLPQA